MSRQPASRAGASGRARSGAAARAPSPAPSSPLPPARYRALRARYNALLATLYERTGLTLREIASLACRTDRAVRMAVRALGCRPRNARACRPGTDVGVRRAGPPLSQLNAPAARRVASEFAGVARALAGSAQAQAACELERAGARAARRTARTQMRVMVGTARQLASLAAAIEHTAATEHALAAGPKRSGAGKPAKAPQPSREEMRRVQERARLEQEARMREAHAAAKAEPAAAPPAFDPELDRRINAIAARHAGEPGPRGLPRIRRV